MFFFNTDDNWGDKSTGRLSFYDRGIKWHLNQFPQPQQGCVRGEFTVLYLADPLAYKRIYTAFPNVKLIVTLRNPIEMVYSLYWYLSNGAIIELPDTFEELAQKGLLLDKGLYYKHLKKFYDLFPNKNIHVILFDDIVNDPQKVLKELFAFLEINPDFLPPDYDKRVNTAFTTRSKLLKRLAHNVVKTINTLKLEEFRKRLMESRRLWSVYATINRKPTHYPKMSKEARDFCHNYYKEDIKKTRKVNPKKPHSLVRILSRQLLIQFNKLIYSINIGVLFQDTLSACFNYW